MNRSFKPVTDAPVKKSKNFRLQARIEPETLAFVKL